MATAVAKNLKGTISQVVGVVIDVEFSRDHLPAVYNALTTELDGKELVFEVALHLSESSVRAIALGSTDGLERGSEVQCHPPADGPHQLDHRVRWVSGL